MTEQDKGVRAAVLTAAETLGIQTYPVPRLGEDDALIRVEVCGLGGSDVTQYLGKLRPSSTVYPVILGHVFVGTVESVGPRAARRWRVAPGDRVVTEAIVPCWACRNCVCGHYSLCDAGEDLLPGQRMPHEDDRAVDRPGDAPSAVRHVSGGHLDDLTGLVFHGLAFWHVEDIRLARRPDRGTPLIRRDGSCIS